jgi:threonine/homoserine efflux transporter RhtA
MNLYLTTLRIRKQTALLLVISAAWATISLSGSWLGMRAEGLTGIAMGWTIAQFAALILTIPLGMGEQAQLFQTKMTHREETVQ